MEYEQHRAGIVRSEVSGPRILGFKIKQANNIHELKSDLELFNLFKITVVLLMSNAIQLTLRIAQFI